MVMDGHMSFETYKRNSISKSLKDSRKLRQASVQSDVQVETLIVFGKEDPNSWSMRNIENVSEKPSTSRIPMWAGSQSRLR